MEGERRRQGMRVRVLAPAVDRTRWERILESETQLCISTSDADVLLLAGPDWRARLETFRGDHDVPTPAVLVTAGTGEDLWTGVALGVSAFVAPGDSAALLGLAQSKARRGQAWFSEALFGTVIEALHGLSEARAHGPLFRAEALQPLTARQREVALLFVDGLTEAEIAQRLDTSRSTVRYHLAEACRRLGIRSRARLVRQVLYPR